MIYLCAFVLAVTFLVAGPAALLVALGWLLVAFVVGCSLIAALVLIVVIGASAASAARIEH